jgi:hypothetical protein
VRSRPASAESISPAISKASEAPSKVRPSTETSGVSMTVRARRSTVSTEPPSNADSMAISDRVSISVPVWPGGSAMARARAVASGSVEHSSVADISSALSASMRSSWSAGPGSGPITASSWSITSTSSSTASCEEYTGCAARANRAATGARSRGSDTRPSTSRSAGSALAGSTCASRPARSIWSLVLVSTSNHLDPNARCK